MDWFASRSSEAWPEPGLVGNFRASLSQWELTPGRIAIVYLFFGFVGLYISDVVFARIFAEPLRSQVQALKGAVEVLVTAGFIYAISVASRRQLERTNRRLERRNEELHVLHRVLRHNLRNDLNVIEGHAEYVVESQRDDDDQSKPCKTILRKTQAIIDYIQRAGQIRRLNERDTVETYDLTEIVPAVVEDSEAITDGVNLTTDIPGKATVRANHMFPAALKELLTNAVIHADSDTPQVSISVSETDAPAGMTAVDIADDGPGIPESVRRVIESDEHDQLAHLSGLGLWFVHWTLTDAGGSLSFDTDGDGTTVRMLVPTADSS